MGTTIRPELSEKNPYWIERHRYYELKHFCLQYPIWKKAYAALDGLSRRPSDMEVFSKNGGGWRSDCSMCRSSISLFRAYEDGRASGDCDRCRVIHLHFKRSNRGMVLRYIES